MMVIPELRNILFMQTVLYSTLLIHEQCTKTDTKKVDCGHFAFEITAVLFAFVLFFSLLFFLLVCFSVLFYWVFLFGWFVCLDCLFLFGM